ncbi:MAG: FAD-dependent oxidoreductase [Kiritimatiellae bacterium]|nr:FAD-dependent oxidoreductase [Kiritimatiellia bacterium]
MGKRIVIIGAGPCGLGAAHRLEELGHQNYIIYEQNSYVGGLSASFRDSKCYTWDFAVHVLHSHYEYMDRLLKHLLPDGYYKHIRKSWVRLYGCWVPYPFQYNFWHLPQHIREECLGGLEKLGDSPKKSASNFKEWIYDQFGEGIANHFMIPYNRKNWSTDPSQMGANWLGDRVPSVDLQRVKRNMAAGVDDIDWGPNALFMFPKNGGTGRIFNAIAKEIPPDKIRLKSQIVVLNLQSKELTLSDGSVEHFDVLISSTPLNLLCRMCNEQRLSQMTDQLRFSHTYVSCLGLERSIPKEMSDKTWIYCPADDACFYRITPFSLFSSSHTPSPEMCSFMCETSRPGEDVMLNADSFDRDTLSGISHLFPCLGLDEAESSNKNKEQIHHYSMCAEYGYPVPTINRDAIVHEVLNDLLAHGVYSRGRFGAWKYEAGNMDHSFMQGVEAADHIIYGTEEITWRYPGKVNNGLLKVLGK